MAYLCDHCQRVKALYSTCVKERDEARAALESVVEIKANEREETGKFRHPRWIGFRDNKNAKDCVWGQK